jgi:hypothetical protein
MPRVCTDTLVPDERTVSPTASDAAPGAAIGQVMASRRKIASASLRVVESGDLSSPRTPGASTPITAPARLASAALAAAAQGLTLVQFSAQRKRFTWDRGGIQGLLRGVRRVLGGIKRCVGCILCQKRLRGS